jgi:hypothetical protein
MSDEVTLVVRRYLWNHELDEAGSPVLAGEAVMRPVETVAVYTTPTEALLQAAHNEILEPGVDQEIRRGDTKLLGKQAIKEAAKALKNHRGEAGHETGILDRGAVGYDTAGELDVVADTKGGRSVG